ncbi:MAG: aminopeptidase P family N-terminal domain-containing protein, partial [Chloroflexota bacterium]
MRQDLNELMKERGLDAFVVTGPVRDNPAMAYMTNGAHLTKGIVIQKRDEDPVLLCSFMERDEAAMSGLTTITLNTYDYRGILREKEDHLAATVELYRRIFIDLGVKGQVGFYGKAEQGQAWLLLNTLNVQLDDITICADFETTLIDKARATKDDVEAERLRAMGRRTCTIVDRTVSFLQSHAVGDDVLLQPDGTPLTLGRVHDEISRFIAEEHLEDPEG